MNDPMPQDHAYSDAQPFEEDYMDDDLDGEDNDDTLVVAPPSMRERLASAQRARANHARASIDIAAHLNRRDQAESGEHDGVTPTL